MRVMGNGVERGGGEDGQITLALVSHTNVGKTTLARTLLRRDVGEVLDRAHVTEESISYTLLDVPAGRLVLWDTPGFGDSVRLLARLRQHDRPLVWFLQQLWDRVADRPLWCSQQAALTIRQQADVVLYLVNATEEPEEAGYVAPELELLEWLGCPVVLLLNQTGEQQWAPERLDQRIAVWRRHVERWSVVGDVVALDAFTRCWVEEGLLLERVARRLDQPARATMIALARAWGERHLEVFDRSMGAIARHLATAAADREVLPERRALALAAAKTDRVQAMERLGTRLERSTAELVRTLLGFHGLEGDAIEALERELDAFQVRGELLEPERGALVGGVLSGAVGGLAADLLAGGLTFGGGVLAGAILGALGGAGLARGYQLVRGEKPAVGWSVAFIEALAEQMLLRYLAIAHFGRGGGVFRQRDQPERWRAQVSEALRHHRDEWRKELERAAKGIPLARSSRALERILRRAASQVLAGLYPSSAKILASERDDRVAMGGGGGREEATEILKDSG